jgi:DNA mismatch repair protein MSH6
LSFQANKAPVEQKVWAHMKYEFLKPEKIRDANKKKMDDPDYNPHTVFVPDDFKKNLTPVSFLF